MTPQIKSIDKASLKKRDYFYMTIEATSKNPSTGKLRKLKQTRMVKVHHIDTNTSILNPSVTMRFVFYRKYYLLRLDKFTYEEMMDGNLPMLENVTIVAEEKPMKDYNEVIHKYYAAWRLKTLSLLRMIQEEEVTEKIKQEMIAYIQEFETNNTDNQITKADLMI